MSLFRARTRFAAVAAAVPVLIAGGPLVSPAVAADPADVRQAALVETQGKLRIGPRAGFRGDVERGVNGNTAIVAFDAAPSTTLQKASVEVRQNTPFSIYDDFDSTDGFAVYKDLNDNDRLDPADHAAGPVSFSGYEIGFSNGAVVVTVAMDPAKATGEDSYLVTVHPSANLSAERDVKFTVPAGGIVTSAGNLPGSKVDIATILLDSKAPAAIPVTNFKPISRPPLETCPGDPAGCGDDRYEVSRAAVADAGDKLGFFNVLGDLSDAALLQRANPSGTGTVPAIYEALEISGSSATPTSLSIGNGTGRDAGVPGSRALNNQASDDLVAVQWDPIGNTVVTPLNNTPPCDQNAPRASTCAAYTPRGNDVTGPSLGYTVTMDQVNASTANTASVPVKAAISGGYDQGVHAFTVRTEVEQLATPEHVTRIAGSNPAAYEVVDGHRGVTKRSASKYLPSTTGTPANAPLVTNVDVSSPTLFPQDELVRSQSRLVDAAGNASAPKPTAPVLKDTIRPTLVKISLIDANGDGDADAGETYRVEFDDAMDQADITSSNVNTKLTVTDPADAACGPTSASASGTNPCVDWGRSPTVTWSPDGKLLSIKLGTPCTPSAEDACAPQTELPKTGDVVTANIAAGTAVSDKNQNTFTASTNSIAISQPVALPFQARTIDTAGVGSNVYSTGRDGVLDAIDLEFTGALKADTVDDVATQFVIKSGDKSIVPNVALAPGTNDTLRLSFTVPAVDKAAFGTGSTPTVTLNNAPNSTTTGLEAATGQAIGAFVGMTALDRAAAVPVSLKTDDANSDGKLDRVLVQFSEAIVHGKENPCGYWVTGYGDSTYTPAAFSSQTGSPACPTNAQNPARNQPSPVPAGATASDTVALKLAVQSSHDTHATPQVSFSQSNSVPTVVVGNVPNEDCMTKDLQGNVTANCPIKDASGNGLGSFTGTAADAAPAVIIERTTADTNSDGRLDEIRIKYSENLNTPSVANAQFTVSDPAYTIMELKVAGNRELTLRLENVQAGSGDTGAKPKLTGFGGTTDLVNNPTPADNGVVVTDKAGPAILGACSSSPAGTNGICPVDDSANDKVTVLFSEPVASGSVQAGDIVLEQPVGTAKTQTVAPAVDGTDGRKVTLTFAQSAIDGTKDGVVRLATAGAVTDTASPANASTQVSNVPLFKAPTVSLNLSCPTPANPGYCTENKVNTGATGTAGITRWRLAETSRGTTPNDSEFKSGVPSVYPESGALGEGKVTLYLSGKDEFGRLTPEVSESITILFAPAIRNFQFVNSEWATRASGSWAKTSTVRDGDNLSIGAHAVGKDAAEWAANSAPLGGGCLAQHMSINAKPLTGASNHTALPPVKCDLTTTGDRPYRQMQFGVVKVAGTTKYPVGTVVKVTDSEGGSMIVDGPNGTQLRRPFISVGARRSWMINDSSVIKVSSTLLNAIPKGANLGYRDGAVLRSGTGYYYVENGVKRPVSTTQLSAWRISTSTAYAPTTTELRGMPTGSRISGTGHAAGTWIKYSDGRIYQIVRNAQGVNVRRRLASTSALRTLVPTSHIYPANSTDSKLAVDTWLRGYRDGTLLKLADGSYAVVARGSLRKFVNTAALYTLGYNPATARAASGTAMPRVNGQAYQIGTVIDRYKITTSVIKVTNKAGTSVETTVIPTIPGLYGLGTLDPVPTGWDFTR